MTTQPICLNKEDSLKLALRKILENRVDSLLVINENQQLIGLITKHSIMVKIFNI